MLNNVEKIVNTVTSYGYLLNGHTRNRDHSQAYLWALLHVNKDSDSSFMSCSFSLTHWETKAVPVDTCVLLVGSV